VLIVCHYTFRASFRIYPFRAELNEFMESQGAASPGLLVLTTGLSKPFRRLEKYAGMLQELERHVEENHPDRGDTQRSISVYKDIAVSVHSCIHSELRPPHETGLFLVAFVLTLYTPWHDFSRWFCFVAPVRDTDHFRVVEKVSERLAMNKQRSHE
jgi:hypothetical protein